MTDGILPKKARNLEENFGNCLLKRDNMGMSKHPSVVKAKRARYWAKTKKPKPAKKHIWKHKGQNKIKGKSKLLYHNIGMGRFEW